MEEIPEKKIRIAAMADIHVREQDKGRFSNCFKEISTQADILIIAVYHPCNRRTWQPRL
jgi:Icc-related predicted phosphoesterase